MTEQDPRGKTEQRMTIGLIPKGLEDMRELQTFTGLNKSDVVNRALAVYRFVAEELANGNDLLVRNRETGDVERVRLV